MAQAAAELGRYPDANGFELKAALAERYDVPADWITLGNGSNDILEIAAHAFVREGPVGRLFAVFVRRLRAGHAGRGRARDRRAGRGLRPRPRRDARRDRRRHAPGLHRQPEQPDRHLHRRRRSSKRSSPRCRATWSSCWTRPTTNTWRRRTSSSRSHWVRRYPEPARLAHLLEGLRPGRPARRLRDRPAGADRPDEPHAPAVQRQFAGAGGGDRRAERQGVPARRARQINRAGYRAADRSVRRARPGIRAVVRQLRAGAESATTTAPARA